jgi:hypothetical protein
MTVVLKDRVKQITTTEGTGIVTLGSTPGGYQGFAEVFSSGNSTYYAIENGSEWEVGIATYGVGGANTLSRDTILDSSTGSRIDLSGRSTVFVTLPASKMPFVDPSGELSLSLNTLSDVAITSASSGEILYNNGTNWVDGRITAPMLGSGTPTSGTYLNGDLQWSAIDLSPYATLASPSFTGTPTAPTAASGTNTTQLATTEFVTTAVSGVDLTPYVPYTGATQALNMGAFGVTAASFITGGGVTSTGTFDLVPSNPSYTLRIGTNGFYPINANTVDCGFPAVSFSWRDLNLARNILFQGTSQDVSIRPASGVVAFRNLANSTDAPITAGAATFSGAGVFNEAGGDNDFRIEGDTEQNLFFVDASTDRIGIGTATPQGLLHLYTGSGVTSNIVIETAGSGASSNIHFKKSSGGFYVGMGAGDASANFCVNDVQTGLNRFVINKSDGSSTFGISGSPVPAFNVYATAATFSGTLTLGTSPSVLLSAGTFNGELAIDSGEAGYFNGNTYDIQLRSDGRYAFSSTTTNNGNSTIDASVGRYGSGAIGVYTTSSGSTLADFYAGAATFSDDVSGQNFRWDGTEMHLHTGASMLIRATLSASAPSLLLQNPASSTRAWALYGGESSQYISTGNSNAAGTGYVFIGASGSPAVNPAATSNRVLFDLLAGRTIFRNISGQVANAIEVQDSAGTVLVNITPDGIAEFRAAGGRFINYNHGTDASPSYSWDIAGNRGYGMSYGGGEIRFSVNTTRALSIGSGGISAVNLIAGNTTKISTGAIYGFKKQVWNNTVAAMTSGHYLGAVNTNGSLSSARTYTLPSAQAGDKYTFIDDNATYRMTIVPNSGDQIIWPDGTVISAATGSVVTTARYQTIELVAVNDTSWIVQKAIDLGTPFTVTP